MASIVSAGTTSATALNMSADTTGVLQLASNNGTVALTVDTSQNIGIGTSSPKSDDGGNKLEVSNNANTVVTLTATNDTTPILNFRSNSVDRLSIQSSSNFGANFLVRSNQDMRFGTNNTERMRIRNDGGITSQPTGGGTLLEQFGCRAWVNFNGTDTVAIRASGNVSSITDNGTGDYTVNFTTAMPDANYSAVGSCFQSGGILIVRTPISPSTSSYGLSVLGAGGADTDAAQISTAVFR